MLSRRLKRAVAIPEQNRDAIGVVARDGQILVAIIVQVSCRNGHCAIARVEVSPSLKQLLSLSVRLDAQNSEGCCEGYRLWL